MIKYVFILFWDIWEYVVIKINLINLISNYSKEVPRSNSQETNKSQFTNIKFKTFVI